MKGAESMVKVHRLKIWPEFYEAVNSPTPMFRKTVEIRKEDERVYQVGDLLLLQEWDPEKEQYTGQETIQLVTHCLRQQPWVPEGYVAMSITEIFTKGGTPCLVL